MRVITGTVRNGKIEVEGCNLPEGATVTVGVPEEESVIELSPEEDAELYARIQEADRGETVDAAEVRELLRRI
jgi:hypothetical protein